MDDPCPSLDYSRNESFFRHKQRLELALETAETIAIYGDFGLRSLRKTVIDIIQAHLEFLDGLPEKQWLLLKTEKFQKSSFQGAEVIVDAGVDESKFSHAYILSRIFPLLTSPRPERQESLGHLLLIRRQVEQQIARFEEPTLNFATTPTGFDDALAHLNYSRNTSFFNQKQRMEKQLESAESVKIYGDAELRTSRKAVVDIIQAHLEVLDGLPEKQWRKLKIENCLDSSGPDKIDPCECLNTPLVRFVQLRPHAGVTYNRFHQVTRIAAPLLSILTTVVILQLLAGLSRDGCNFVLNAVKVLISIINLEICRYYDSKGILGDVPPFILDTSQWPSDVRTALQEFGLDPHLVHYAVCPKCRYTYKPKTADNPEYPAVCSYRVTDDSPPCGTPLLQGNADNLVPRSRYSYQPMASWLARLMMRPGMEDLMEKTVSSVEQPAPLKQTDIWHANIFRTFKGPDKKPFLPQPPGSAHLIFSIFIDWFNPYSNRQGGKHASVGAIYLICMNLPISIRYRLENVYLVGVLPGPNEPSLDQVNHFLRPLVDDLIRLWSHGIFFTKTYKYKFGRLVRCAVIPLIADSPAARKAVGYEAPTSTFFCTFCTSSKFDMANFDVSSWTPRSWKEHLIAARAWLNAPTETKRQEQLEKNHVRWSEFLRLPYWNPVKFPVVDAMHNLFLVDCQAHCRFILGMNVAKKKSSKTILPHTPEKQNKCLDALEKALQKCSQTGLDRLRKGYLVRFVQDNGIVVPQKAGKRTYIEYILKWVNALIMICSDYVPLTASPQKEKYPGAPIRRPKVFSDPELDLSTHGAKEPPKEVVLDQDVLHEVWADLAATTLPSWMGRVPRNLGSAAHGKLSADQWRTACTVHFVITLIRLWGMLPNDDRRKQILDNFIALVTAVLWAAKRSSSEEHIAIIRNQFEKYLTSLVDLFTTDALRPNHHLSLHLAECLEMFGPAHGWWAFPFERYNGVLQRFNTNSKIGEILVLEIYYHS